MKNILIFTVLFFAFSAQLVNAADFFCCERETTECASADASSGDSTQHDCENCALCSHCASVLTGSYNIVSVDNSAVSTFSEKENTYSSRHIAKYPKPPCA